MWYYFKSVKGLISLFGITVSVLAFISITTNCSNRQKPVAHETAWEFHSQRAEIEPAHWVEGEILFEGEPTLAISGDGKAYVNGSWTNTYDIDSKNCCDIHFTL